MAEGNTVGQQSAIMMFSRAAAQKRPRGEDSGRGDASASASSRVEAAAEFRCKQRRTRRASAETRQDEWRPSRSGARGPFAEGIVEKPGAHALLDREPRCSKKRCWAPMMTTKSAPEMRSWVGIVMARGVGDDPLRGFVERSKILTAIGRAISGSVRRT